MNCLEVDLVIERLPEPDEKKMKSRYEPEQREAYKAELAGQIDALDRGRRILGGNGASVADVLPDALPNLPRNRTPAIRQAWMTAAKASPRPQKCVAYQRDRKQQPERDLDDAC